jgi:hypothetical protein
VAPGQPDRAGRLKQVRPGPADQLGARGQPLHDPGPAALPHRCGAPEGLEQGLVVEGHRPVEGVQHDPVPADLEIDLVDHLRRQQQLPQTGVRHGPEATRRGVGSSACKRVNRGRNG